MHLYFWSPICYGACHTLWKLISSECVTHIIAVCRTCLRVQDMSPAGKQIYLPDFGK
jgi:hypothetical protein